MRNIYFILLMVAYLILANLTVFHNGYSYIGYSLLFSISFGLQFFNVQPRNIFQKNVYYIIFMVSLLYVVTEILYKVKFVVGLFDPTKYNYLWFTSILFIIISILIHGIWQKKNNPEK